MVADCGAPFLWHWVMHGQRSDYVVKANIVGWSLFVFGWWSEIFLFPDGIVVSMRQAH